MAKSEPTSGTDTPPETQEQDGGAGVPPLAPGVSEAPSQVEGNVSSEDYTTRGQTVVATRRGYRFTPEDKSIPVITRDGVKVTKEQADALVAESGGLVEIKNEEG